MNIGFMNLGAVNAIRNHVVETRFFAYGLPLFPLKSYVMKDDEVLCEIPLHLKSFLRICKNVHGWHYVFDARSVLHFLMRHQRLYP